MGWLSRETGTSWIPIPALIPASCVTVDKLLDFSVPCFHTYKISLMVNPLTHLTEL